MLENVTQTVLYTATTRPNTTRLDLKELFGRAITFS